MNTAIAQYKKIFRDKEYIYQLITSLAFLFIAMLASSLANGYATAHLGPSVPDIILSNIPAMGIVALYIFSAMIFALFVIILFIWRPITIPFLALSLGLFYLTRSGFVILTNTGLPAGMFSGESLSPFIKQYFFGGDLFFSGHAGAPFLLALAFWNHHPALRTIFLTISIASAIIVLVGHYHYSIDVAAAYFITYTIYKIAKHWFPVAFTYFKQASF